MVRGFSNCSSKTHSWMVASCSKNKLEVSIFNHSKRNQGILSNVGPRPTQMLSSKVFLTQNIHRLVKSNFEPLYYGFCPILNVQMCI